MKASLLRVLMALFVVTGITLPALAASDFPNRTVRILVGFAPGGTTDLLARIVADELRSTWNTAVVIENRPGADGIVATTAVHNAPPDGYTLLMSTNALVITPHLKALPYKPLEDFEPITIVGQEYHHLLVTPKLPVATVKDFIDLAKSRSGRADVLLGRARQRPVPGHAALHAGVRCDEYGPCSISRLDAGRHGAGHSGCSVDVLIALNDAAAVPGRYRAHGATRTCPTRQPWRSPVCQVSKATPGSPDGAVQGTGGRLGEDPFGRGSGDALAYGPQPHRGAQIDPGRQHLGRIPQGDPLGL